MPEPGQIIRSKYRLEKFLGQGGMGTVWVAKHLGWDEDCVVKVLKDPQAAAGQNLRAEAKLLRQLRHPNIVQVEDIDATEDGLAFIAMEWVRGESLRNRLDRGPLPLHEAIRIAASVCDALDFAHARGVIHRDVKPHNVLIEERTGLIKLIDFGIAKVREEAQVSATGMITAPTGMFLGTPEYASPEQARGLRGFELDGRSDIYSVGLMLYEMVSGVLLFRADTPLATLMRRVLEEPPPLTNIPPALNAVILRALAKDRNHRFSSAAEMRAALDSLTRPNAYAPPPQPQLRTVVESAPSFGASAAPESSNRLQIVVIAAAALVLIGSGAAYTLLHDRTKPPQTPPAVVKEIKPPEQSRKEPATSQATRLDQPDYRGLGDAALSAGDFRTALGHFRKAGDNGRLAGLQRAIENDTQERAGAALDVGDYPKAKRFVDSWLTEFPQSDRLRALRARVAKAEAAQ